ncbi:hypothetical protein ES703_73965 [subsurface metagenome]
MGAKIMLAMTYSSHIKACYDYVNENKILVISDHSTSPALCISDDYIFRLCPDDTRRAIILTQILQERGIEAVVVLQRGDAWGDGMYDAFKENFEGIGGDIVYKIRYLPDIVDFSPEVALVNENLRKAITEYGEDKVAVQALGFSELLNVIELVKDYPLLKDAFWLNGELAGRIREGNETSVKMMWMCPVDAPSESPKYREWEQSYYDVTAELAPGSQSTNMRDSMWLTALSIISTASYDTEAIKEVLPTVADNYFGASGWCALNEYGDRDTDYDIMVVRWNEEQQDYLWTAIGHYSIVSGTLTWSSP